MQCEKNIAELVFAINEMSEHLKNTSKHIERQAKLLKYLNSQNELAQAEIKLLKQRQNLTDMNKGN